jgi:hypothetical protein
MRSMNAEHRRVDNEAIIGWAAIRPERVAYVKVILVHFIPDVTIYSC